MIEDDKKDSRIHIVTDADDSAAAGAIPARATDEESRDSSAQVAKLQAELDETRQTLARRQADFENARKRMERERGEDSRRITGHTIERFLPVLDALERALAAHKEPAYEEYRKGFELIQRQFLDTLKRLGAERVDPLGKLFDPHLHQAIERVDSADHEDGAVLEVFQPGYLFHGKVIRPATVRVAVHPSSVSSEDDSSSNLVN